MIAEATRPRKGTARTRTAKQTTWHVVGASIQGAAHGRQGLPNQDRLGWWPTQGAGGVLVLAVADGHGSAKCFRSGRGAELAVQAAVRIVSAFVRPHRQPDNLSAVKRLAEEIVPRSLERQWKHLVASDLRRQPFTNGEWQELRRRAGDSAVASMEHSPDLAYGTTLLAVVVAPAFLIGWQIGDGELLVVSAAGQVEPLVPADERLFGNDTTSLASSESWRDFRVGFRALLGEPPAIILAATDGYPNSFRDEAAFRQVGFDLLEMLRTRGAEWVCGQMETWLKETSSAGSGDDITLGVIGRSDVMKGAGVTA